LFGLTLFFNEFTGKMLMSSMSIAVTDAWDARLFYFRCAIAVIAFVILATVVYRLFFHPLAGIPGPLLARCSTLWQNWRYFHGTWHADILRVHEKYGPVVRISPYEVSFIDADALKRVSESVQKGQCFA
jgi:hypothetical protein